MAETKIIKAVFGGTRSTVTQPRYTSDYGQVIEVVGVNLPEYFETYFANSPNDKAKKVLGQNGRVTIPQEYTANPGYVYAWVMVHDDITDGRAMYTIKVPIKKRAEPTDEEPLPEEVDIISQAIATLNSAVEQTAQDVESADASAQSARADADRAETARDTTEEYVSTVQGYAHQAQTAAQNASASATASAQSASTAQQIKTDVDGMVDDAQSAASASALSATESAQSASRAYMSASVAAQDASASAESALQAQASAQTASTKATEASNSASTASQKASESSQSAFDANGYATAAGQAKTAAETAQGLAEQAQSNAESAKDDAESARDEAQQIASGISGKVEQIDQNTADIASLEADRYKAYVTDTATGAVASFSDGADDVPMEDVTVQIEPVQDLHGQENPYPAGGGKNLFGFEKWLSDNGVEYTKSGNFYTFRVITELFTRPFVFSETDTEVTLSFESFSNGTSENARMTLLDSSNRSVRTVSADTTTVKITCTACKVRMDWKTGGAGTVTIKAPQIELGSTATSYAPYENICPISGWTGANVSHSGADTSDATVYSITFPSEVGTVYGGTLDVTTGELVVTMAEVDLGTLTWALNNHVTIGTYFFANIPLSMIKYRGEFNTVTYPILTPLYKASRRTLALFLNGCICFDGNNTLKQVRQIQIKDARYSDADEFKTAMQGVMLCYELATPITITLTPTEIKSLLGDNNIWADTGDTTAVYRADTTLYINRKIAEAVSALS